MVHKRPFLLKERFDEVVAELAVVRPALGEELRAMLQADELVVVTCEQLEQDHVTPFKGDSLVRIGVDITEHPSWGEGAIGEPWRHLGREHIREEGEPRREARGDVRAVELRVTLPELIVNALDMVVCELPEPRALAARVRGGPHGIEPPLRSDPPPRRRALRLGHLGHHIEAERAVSRELERRLGWERQVATSGRGQHVRDLLPPVGGGRWRPGLALLHLTVRLRQIVVQEDVLSFEHAHELHKGLGRLRHVEREAARRIECCDPFGDAPHGRGDRREHTLSLGDPLGGHLLRIEQSRLLFEDCARTLSPFEERCDARVASKRGRGVGITEHSLGNQLFRLAQTHQKLRVQAAQLVAQVRDRLDEEADPRRRDGPRAECALGCEHLGVEDVDADHLLRTLIGSGLCEHGVVMHAENVATEPDDEAMLRSVVLARDRIDSSVRHDRRLGHAVRCESHQQQPAHPPSPARPSPNLPLLDRPPHVS